MRLLLQVRDDPKGGYEVADALLDAHIAHVSARIRELRDLQKELEALRQQCTGRTATDVQRRRSTTP